MTTDDMRPVESDDPVIPASMSFALNGIEQTQTGSTFTVALRRVDARWLLTAWSWSKGQ